jgi:hypothetical protein
MLKSGLVILIAVITLMHIYLCRDQLLFSDRNADGFDNFFRK